MDRLIPGLTAREDRPDLEERQIRKAPRLIARGGLQETGQQIGAQMGHFRADRVLDPRGLRPAAKERRRPRVDEAVGHAFVVTKGRDRAPRGPLAQLRRRQHGAGHTRGFARHRPADELGQRGNPRHLFDQIGLAQHIGAPARRGDHVARKGEAERLERRALRGLGYLHADEADDPHGVQPIGTRGIGHRAIHDHLRRLAAAEVEHHLRRQLQPRQGEFRVHAPLEPIARIRVDLERAARRGNRHRVPIGAFKEHIDSLISAARQLAAHDPGKALGALVIHDHHLTGRQRIGLAVQRQQLLAALRGHDPQLARDLGRVEDMQRAVQVIGEEVGDIDQRRNRAQADSHEPRLQPSGARPVLDATDQTAGKERAALGLEARIYLDRHRTGEAPRHRLDFERFQHTQTPRRQIARNAAHAQRIGTVRGDLDVDHRIDRLGAMLGQPVGEPLADLAVRELDDAVMLVAQLQLAFRTHHPVAFHAADLADAQRHVDAGHIIAGLGQHDRDPRAGIRRAADDGLLALVGQHIADPQLVGIGVLFGVQNAGQREGGQLGRGVHDLLDLEAQIGQRLGDLVHIGRGIEMVFQPGEGEFHWFSSKRLTRSKPMRRAFS